MHLIVVGVSPFNYGPPQKNLISRMTSMSTMRISQTYILGLELDLAQLPVIFLLF